MPDMATTVAPRPRSLPEQLLVALLFFVGGLAMTRLLYEGLFPRALGLARPLPVFLLALLVALLGWLGWRLLARLTPAPAPAWAFAPLLLNLLYLFNPAVNLQGSRLVFAAALWLTAVFLVRALAPASWWPWLGILFVTLALGGAYLLTISPWVGQADTFEFQVVAPQLGIAHPTGYPLYLLLARLFSGLPVGTMAWRVNLASAVFAMLAAALLYLTGRRLLNRELPPLLAAVFLGLTPTVWSQAIVAEVYALHALIVTAVLWLLILTLDHGEGRETACAAPFVGRFGGLSWAGLIWLLAFLLGLGLTNHLTTLFLLPPALLTLVLAYGRCLRANTWRANLRLGLGTALAFLAPLLLYAYLPLRWQAVNDEAMGLARFLDWVAGGRFQGALQWSGWLTDPARYQIVGRLLLVNWGWFNLLLAALGLLFLARRNWPAALVLVVTWLGFIFYALNYYVPDLAVFIIPAQIVIALFWGAGLVALLEMVAALLGRGRPSLLRPAQAILLLLLIIPALNRIVSTWPDTRHAAQEALQAWGAGVLDLPLPQGAAILADSEKIAPLYYLQQAEGMRRDLEIMVLPDEGAYRAELEARLAAGQPVFLARFLPGLEGSYHLRSRGPLLEVSQDPLTTLPAGATAVTLDFDALRLLAYDLQEPAAIDPQATAVTLYWQARQPTTAPHFVYTRWLDPQTGEVLVTSDGQHPAGNYYPTVAWRGEEIVPDFHLLPRPLRSASTKLQLQVALGLPFAAPPDLHWQTVTTVDVAPVASPELARQLRAQNGHVLLSGVEFPSTARSQSALPLLLSGYGSTPGLLRFSLVPDEHELPAGGQPPAMQSVPPPLLFGAELQTGLAPGAYRLWSEDPMAASRCGWLAEPTAVCDLGPVAITGTSLPSGATNFEDKIALLSIDLPARVLEPGGSLPVVLQWQGLAEMSENYTVFLQLLDAQDRLVGQVDAWPRQGTFPTSEWPPGEQVQDPYEIRLDSNLPPGDYRLQVGLYLLGTLRRLPVLDEQGLPVDDKVVVSGLSVAE